MRGSLSPRLRFGNQMIPLPATQRNKEKIMFPEDIQNRPDHRHIEIQKVGVKNIKYPIIVKDKKNKTQHTIATFNMYVNLPHHFKGTHMSRFIELLNEYRQGIDIKNVPRILAKI